MVLIECSPKFLKIYGDSIWIFFRNVENIIKLFSCMTFVIIQFRKQTHYGCLCIRGITVPCEFKLYFPLIRCVRSTFLSIIKQTIFLTLSKRVNISLLSNTQCLISQCVGYHFNGIFYRQKLILVHFIKYTHCHFITAAITFSRWKCYCSKTIPFFERNSIFYIHYKSFTNQVNGKFFIDNHFAS